MKTAVKITLLVAVVAAVGAAAYKPAVNYWKGRNRPTWRQTEVARGSIVFVVNSTGTVKPVKSVQVGSFVSGPIVAINVDFNDEVKEGAVLAEIDPRIFKANVLRDKALLATKEAEVTRVEARLQQAVNDENRALSLQKENKDFISSTELDEFKFNALAIKAQLVVAKANVDSARANLKNSEANLGYTEITAPVDGIVIDRKIDPGQTLAAQFQTPELFVVAPNMRENMHVFASVDEADIGLIRQAKEQKQPVHFTVDAYPDDLFEGSIEQIRMSSTTTQNVVTYPVVVTVANPDLKLMPGMTASISFRIEEKENAVKIPNSALRFYPNPQHVRSQDRNLLEGASTLPEEDEESWDTMLSATEKSEAKRRRNRRHVWVVDGLHLKAIEVITGLSDHEYTEMVSGGLKPEQKLVTGIKPKNKGF